MGSLRLGVRTFVVSALVALMGAAGAFPVQEDAPPPAAPGSSADGTAAETSSESASAEGDADAGLRLAGTFAQIDELRDVRVEVHAGVARLTGTVPDREAADLALGLAEKAEGIVHVRNGLETVSDVRTLLPDRARLHSWARDAIGYVPRVLVALVLLAAFVYAATRVRRLPFAFGPLATNGLLQSLVQRTAAVLVLFLGLIVALNVLDLAFLLGAVLGGAGVLGLAIGFAFRDIVENYLAGLLLSFRQPFAPKDFVEIDGKMGTVIRMTASQTVLLSFDGIHMRIPNATVFKGIVSNYSRNPARRFEFGVPVAADSDLGRAQDVGMEVLRSLQGVLTDPGPFTEVAQVDETYAQLKWYAWLDQTKSDYLKLKSEATRMVKAALHEQGFVAPPRSYRVALDRDGKGEPAPPPQSRGQADTAADTHMQDQVERELAGSAEPNLLTPESEPVAR